eukprot:m.496855 g.496855  ORF g.496855 m.496855 type:complete len:221 (-) comp21809_c0_seq55:801-1463(-)
MAHNVRGRCRWHTNETVSTGCGYYAHHLSLSPYTIATATTGAAFFSEYTAGVVSGEPDVCGGSINWILNTINRSTGVIPYILDNTSSTAQWPWDTASYVTEGLVAAVVRNCSVAQHERWRMSMLPVLRRALAEQNAWGLWGVAGSADAMRAPRVGTLLSFYAALGTGSVDVPQKPARFFACDQIFRNWPGWIPRNVQQADYVVSALSVIECVLTVYALWF